MRWSCAAWRGVKGHAEGENVEESKRGMSARGVFNALDAATLVGARATTGFSCARPPSYENNRVSQEHPKTQMRGDTACLLPFQSSLTTVFAADAYLQRQIENAPEDCADS